MRVSKFEHFSEAVISKAKSFSQEALPEFSELAELARVSKVALKIIVLDEGNECLGISCCYIENTRIGGIPIRSYSVFGHDFFDYCAIYFQPGYRERLIAEISADAKDSGADCVFLKGMLFAHEFQPLSGALYASPTRIFRKSLSENGFSPLLKKKSVKRHVNKCKRALDYSCEHYSGEQICAADIEEMASLHVETRAYHHTSSVFKSPKALSRYLNSSQNRVLTKISAAGEVIAYHYGHVWGNTMIWHTPVVNIKYLEYSPLEVLLFETLSYCESREIEVFDLGRGEEPYKARFSNDQRPMFSLIIPVSIKGKLIKALKDAEYRYRLRDTGKNIQRSIMPYLSALKAHISRVNYYCMSPANSEIKSDTVELLIIEDFPSLVDFSRTSGMCLNQSHYNKFRSGLALAVLNEGAEGGLSCCWLSRGKEIYVPEIDHRIDAGNMTVLVGFEAHLPSKICKIAELTRQVSVRLNSPTIATYAINIDRQLNRQISAAGYTKVNDFGSRSSTRIK